MLDSELGWLVRLLVILGLLTGRLGHPLHTRGFIPAVALMKGHAVSVTRCVKDIESVGANKQTL